MESVARQPEVDEVIVVNDQSTDRTPEILNELASRIVKLKVLTIDELPRGWVGKNYALSLGAAAATGEWLLFTDADTYHVLGSVRRALVDAGDHDAVLVSYSPEQEMETWWERAVVPFVYCRLAAKFSYARINDPSRPDAAANGQFILILRDAYEAIGGQTVLAAEILEDVALARLVKKAGYGIYFTAPIAVVRTRMYRSFQAMWEGWTKNLYLLMGGSVKSMLTEMIEAAPLLELVMLAALAIFCQAGAPTIMIGSLGGVIGGVMLLRLLSYAGALYRNLYPVSYIQYAYLGAALYGAALVVSWWNSTHGAVVWKGRAYRTRAR